MQDIKNHQRNSTILLLVIALITGILVQSGDLGSIDTIIRLQETHSYWTDLPPIDPSNDELGLVGRNGILHNQYGMGQSFVMLPADILATKIVESLGISSGLAEKMRIALVSYFTFPLITMLVILTGFKFLKSLGFNQVQSIGGGLGLLFCTTFLHYTQINQENSLLLLTTLCGYYFHYNWVTKNINRYLGLGFLFLGFGLLVRLTTVLDSFCVFLFVVSLILLQAKTKNSSWEVPKTRIVKYCSVGFISYSFFLLLDRLYHWLRFGELWSTYLGIWAKKQMELNPTLPDNFPFSTSFLTGFLGFTVSPEKSLVLFEPLLLLTVLLLVLYRHKIPIQVSMLCLTIITSLCFYITFYSTYAAWQGGSCWGPRFLTVPLEMLGMLSIPLLLKIYPNFKNKIEPIGYAILISISFIIQVSSVIFWYHLEVEQYIYNFDRNPTFIIGLRWLNIIAVSLGQFEQWGLSYPRYTERMTTLNFTPFLASQYLSPKVGLVMELTWVLLLLSLLLLIAKLYMDMRNMRHQRL